MDHDLKILLVGETPEVPELLLLECLSKLHMRNPGQRAAIFHLFAIMHLSIAAAKYHKDASFASLRMIVRRNCHKV